MFEHLIDLNTIPPGGLRFTHPSGFVSTGITFSTLVGRVAQYRQNRGEPVVSPEFINLSDEIEAHICDAMSPEDRVANCNMTRRIPTIVSWRLVAAFLKTAAAWLTTGFNLVPQEEAERRAAICIKCPFNVGLGGCGICRETIAGLRDNLMKATTSNDAGLQACGVCGCDNRTQVHVPLDVLRAGTGELDYPSWCWKKRDFIAAV